MQRFFLPKNRGLVLVDDEDFDWLSKYKWNMLTQKENRANYVRAVKNNKTVYMHRLIMNAPKGMQVDHINGNGLDNRRANLRLATAAQNRQNRLGKNRYGYKGVIKSGRNYRANIRANGKLICGKVSFNTAKEAHEEYKRMARIHHGEFANFECEQTT